jgi:hypothetical protein
VREASSFIVLLTGSGLQGWVVDECKLAMQLRVANRDSHPIFQSSQGMRT